MLLGYVRPVAVVVVTHPRFAEHVAGAHHPERPARLDAVLAGVDLSSSAIAVSHVAARAATVAELERVHSKSHIDAIEDLCRRGGGSLDPDTAVVPASYEVALLAAGAGLEAVDRLDHGEGDAAFCVVRPPGHHATATRAMGFCLFNNIAVVAAALAERGERVLIVDFDVHHGNGTQETFWDDPRVGYISMHQYPLYPGTGAIEDVGGHAALGSTVNLPFPPGTAGDAYMAACDEVVAPVASELGATWLLLSAGFDAHRRDPLADMSLSAGDFGAITARLAALVPDGRRIAFLEGGYDLDALTMSAAACVGALGGVTMQTESLTSGGRGRDVVDVALKTRARMLDS